ncbi:MAG: hypothetical protein ACC707_11395, partial [Thiohalomonadales bacterium]
MDDNNNKTDIHLHTFIDGRLDRRSQLKAQAFLHKYSSKNTEFKSYQATDKQIRAALDEVYQEIPVHLTDIIDNFKPLADKTPWWKKPTKNLSLPLLSIHISIAILAIFMGYFIAEYTLQNREPPKVNKYVQIARLAVEAHVIYSAETDHAVELGADKKVELMSWFSKRLGVPVRSADLSEENYQLLGGRLLPSIGEYAAFFMYANDNDDRLSLYIRSHTGITDNKSGDLKCNNGDNQMFACSWYGR